jgi:predicted TIM-barrel fold metal-dependent hydrolase
MGVYLYPAQLKDSLRNWLELYPEKISFGSDAFPFSAAVGAEESYWLAATSARTAVAAALAEMISEGEITEAKALEMARGYLHDNAVRMYSSLQGASK